MITATFLAYILGMLLVGLIAWHLKWNVRQLLPWSRLLRVGSFSCAAALIGLWMSTQGDDALARLALGSGTFAAVLINFPLPEVLKMSKAAIKVIRSHAFDPSVPIPLLVSYADKARQEGLLSLEDSVEEVEDDFLKSGMHLIIDGTEPDEVRDIMETEIEYLEKRHKRGQQLFLAMAKYSPAFGMVGTLIGLINMLASMDDPSTIGPSMAVALITTMYGAGIANLICLPIAGKLKLRSAGELLLKQLCIEGIMAIQSGDNPRIVEGKLKAFISPSQRTIEAESAEQK